MARRNSRSVTESIVKYSGSPRFLGAISFTSTSKTNNDATAFNNTGTALCGKVLLLQTDQDVYILPVNTATGAVTSSNGIKLLAGVTVTITMDDLDSRDEAGEFYGWLAALRVSADGTLKVWELV